MMRTLSGACSSKPRGDGVRAVAYTPKALDHGSGQRITSRGVNLTHSVYEHLHFDLQEVLDADKLSRVETFCRGCAADGLGRIGWENFRRLDFATVKSQYDRSAYPVSNRLAMILADDRIFGAPSMHLTAKYSGPASGRKRARFDTLYDRATEFCADLDSSGYIERELVSYRVKLLPASGEGFDPPSVSPVCLLPAFRKIPLSVAGRHFRTTEIHVTFEHLHRVSPEILSALFERGFCSAFRFDEATGDFSVIATIQGFEREILHILVRVEEWLLAEMGRGFIGCETVIKKEDIVSFYVFGEDPGIQQVVEPGSVV